MKKACMILLLLPIFCQSYSIEKSITAETSPDGSSDVTITKRSGGGSFDFVRQIKTSLLSGVGRASASLASGSSGSSSGHTKEEEPHANSVEYDPWSLKKSVLNTLFQAVKAITGGVTAIKGQLIKGSGYALSAGGSLIAASGDKITDVGKGIVNSAQLVPVQSSGSQSNSFVGKYSSVSSSSSGGGHSVNVHGPTGHSETIPSYDIPSGHSSYGPPSKSPAYTSTSHYLPPAPYSGGHQFTGGASFESAAPLNYLPVEGQYY